MKRTFISMAGAMSISISTMALLESAHAENMPQEVNEFLVEKLMKEHYGARAGFVENVLSNQAANGWANVHKVMTFLSGTLLEDALPGDKRDRIYPRLMTFSGLEGDPAAASFGENDVSLMGVLLPNDLTARFKGRDPVTIFALTNLSLAKRGGHLKDLLEREDYEALGALMKHHVVEGGISEADLRSMDQVKVLSGATLRVERNKNGLVVGGAKVVRTIETANGVIHVIDRPLRSGPEREQDRAE